MKKVKINSVGQSEQITFGNSILFIKNGILSKITLDEIYNSLYNVGFGLFPLNTSSWKSGYIDGEGNEVNSALYRMLKKYVDIKPGREYRINNQIHSQITIRIYDSSYNVIQGANRASGLESDLVFTTLDNAKYMRLYVDLADVMQIYDYGFKIVEI